MTTEKIPIHDDQAWRRQLELNNKRLLEDNLILAEKLRLTEEAYRNVKGLLEDTFREIGETLAK